MTTSSMPLQELNKLISYSGTPTVVWRRTGEICLVGPEFCMLTGWSKEDLLGTKKYIWEVSTLGVWLSQICFTPSNSFLLAI